MHTASIQVGVGIVHSCLYSTPFHWGISARYAWVYICGTVSLCVCNVPPGERFEQLPVAEVAGSFGGSTWPVKSIGCSLKPRCELMSFTWSLYWHMMATSSSCSWHSKKDPSTPSPSPLNIGKGGTCCRYHPCMPQCLFWPPSNQNSHLGAYHLHCRDMWRRWYVRWRNRRSSSPQRVHGQVQSCWLPRIKDGATRFCVDYRKLNAVTKMDVYPLPRIDNSFDLLSGQQFFTTLDLVSGYWQVHMANGAREKTAFTTHTGLYEFRVMPFGLCNAPATFQRLMDTVLAGLTRDKDLVVSVPGWYIELVVGHTVSEHLDNLRSVLQRLWEAGLKLKPTKCSFMQTQVECLGHIVSKHGASVDPRKTAAVKEFPRPVDLKSLSFFWG